MADTNRISIGETEAQNARVPRVVIGGGASMVWMSGILKKSSWFDQGTPRLTRETSGRCREVPCARLVLAMFRSCMNGKTAQLYGITAQSNSLAQLLSSSVKAEVFRLLFGLDGQPLHVRELERRSGLAIGTVRQELARLTKLGLIAARADGNRKYYTAREDHPLYPEIRGLVLKTSGLADVLRRALEKEERITLAFIFGSIAQAREQAHSDIDLLIVGDIGLRQVTKLLGGVADKVGREINPKVFTPREFRRRKRANDPFLNRVLATPRIFVIGDEHELGNLG